MATISESEAKRKTILNEFLTTSNSLLDEIKAKNDSIENRIFRISGERQSWNKLNEDTEKKQEPNFFKDRLSILLDRIRELNTQADCILNKLMEIA